MARVEPVPSELSKPEFFVPAIQRTRPIGRISEHADSKGANQWFEAKSAGSSSHAVGAMRRKCAINWRSSGSDSSENGGLVMTVTP